MRQLTISDQLPPVGVIGLGTAEFGSGVSVDESYRMMDAWLESGGNLLDSAHIYAAWLPGGDGKSERTVGRWVRDREARKKVLLCTKGGHPPMDNIEKRRLRPEVIGEDLEQSLDRLGMDYVDLYWLHRDNPQVPVDELLDALNDQIREGLIRAIGASNWRSERLRSAMAYAEKSGKVGFCASQIGWSVARANEAMQGTMGGLVYMDETECAFYRETQMPVFAFTSQGAGFFGDRYDWEKAASEADGKAWFLKQLYGNADNKVRRDRVRELASQKRVSPTTIALAWLLNQDIPCVPLLGPKTMSQLEGSLQAIDLTLTKDEVDWLDY